MLRRLAAVAACAVLLGRRPDRVTLRDDASFERADVWIDGIYVGRSPLVLDALAAGRHTLGLTKTGWDPQQLDVSRGRRRRRSARRARAREGAVPARHAARSLCTGRRRGRCTWTACKPAPSKDGTIPVTAGTHELAVRTSRGRITRDGDGLAADAHRRRAPGRGRRAAAQRRRAGRGLLAQERDPSRRRSARHPLRRARGDRAHRGSRPIASTASTSTTAPRRR